MIGRITLVIILTLVVGWRMAAAQPNPLPESDYWALVQRTANVLRRGEAAEPLIGQWEALQAVETASGARVVVDTGYYVALLQNDEVDAAIKAEQFDALLNLRDVDNRAVDGAAALAALTPILAQQQFQYVSVLPNWLVRAGDLLERVVEYAFRLIELGIDAGIATVTGWVVAGVAVLALAAVLWYWLRGVSTQFSADSAADDCNENGDLISADAAFDQAQRLANQNDYRQAVRFLYLSTLLSLDERGLLRYDRSKTNREYLRSVRGSEFAATLHSVVDVFDRVWYGFQPIDAATFEQYAGAVRRLRDT